VKRDRDGSVIDDEQDTGHGCELLDDEPTDVHYCVDGWQGQDHHGRPSPCPTCRPHLQRRAGVLVVAPRAAQVSERDWQQRVVDLAQLRGWKHFHAYSSRRSTAGWPDLAMVRTGRLVLAELKAERGQVSTEQRQWLDLLGTVAGVEVHLWRPVDWPTVQQVLR